jgi:hypothetical protein
VVGQNTFNNSFDYYLVDKGCSDHMVYEHVMLEIIEELVHKVTVANRESLTTTQRGTLVVSGENGVEIELKNVLAVPELNCNLLWVRLLASGEFIENFQRDAVGI